MEDVCFACDIFLSENIFFWRLYSYSCTHTVEEKTWSERNLYVSAQFMVESLPFVIVTHVLYRYESIEYIFLYTCIRIHNTYVTYVRTTN